MLKKSERVGSIGDIVVTTTVNGLGSNYAASMINNKNVRIFHFLGANKSLIIYSVTKYRPGN